MFRYFASIIFLLAPKIITGHVDGEWLETKDLPFGRSDMTATTVSLYDTTEGHGMIYIAGGCISGNEYQVFDDWEGYDCVEITDQFLSFEPNDEEDDYDGKYVILEPMPVARFRHAAVDVDGKLWIIGGRDRDGAVVKQIDIYDIKAKTWETLKDYDDAVSDHAAFSKGTDIYVVGGWPEDYSKVLKTVTKIDTVSTLQNRELVAQSMSPMNIARGDIHGVVPSGGKYAYVVGGFGFACEDGPLESTERYDIENNKWDMAPSLLSPRGDLALVEMKQKVYIIGGEHNNYCASDKPFSTALDDVEVLDVSSSDTKWMKQNDIPMERFRFAAASYPEKNAIFIFGGQLPLNSEENKYPVTAEVHVLLEDVEEHEHGVMGATSSGVRTTIMSKRSVMVAAFISLGMIFV
mmetsp:Transcript_16969/g.38186  ORF Transcript_16969/g.38186 Transcript_16969/m.38186 type:complete len:406 (-) Transcript_16969:74-1291(-)|eukprot:CAMPEP_0113307096 /NCGR_PEP_ID=MMETSP0010_2-20120614/6085_1 /TAXON_ID=216773 ORGANISM="Corethron hystrix, Strain 308" /NCGR_SAMPLE_ID=MMETSP0010_2 /ASSEMBLY_ACC=CAM_ASM_000155 /LENGTH=405 /DNA_ID=CAMNT_0000161897 /DNA_START=128 /DNA_END=1345 /DNA_ORIENTATION=+ /assembly_acc=CAM_ASM_000155